MGLAGPQCAGQSGGNLLPGKAQDHLLLVELAAGYRRGGPVGGGDHSCAGLLPLRRADSHPILDQSRRGGGQKTPRLVWRNTYFRGFRVPFSAVQRYNSASNPIEIIDIAHLTHDR